MTARIIGNTLHKAASGKRLDHEEAVTLYRHAPLIHLGNVAHQRRQQQVPGRAVTYVLDSIVDITVPHSQRLQQLAQATAHGCRQLLLHTLPAKDGASVHYSTQLAWLRNNLPPTVALYMQPTQVIAFARYSSLSLADSLRQLQQAGLAGLIGSYDQTPDWFSCLRKAQHLGLHTVAVLTMTATTTPERWVDSLLRLRCLQDYSQRHYGEGFGLFVCQAQTTENTNPAAYLRCVALARLFLDNITHHQADWKTHGVENAQNALNYGADDFGGTLAAWIASTDIIDTNERGQHTAETQLREWINLAGYQPLCRDDAYNTLSPQHRQMSASTIDLSLPLPTKEPTVLMSSTALRSSWN